MEKGDVDVSALRDQIKQLEAKTVEQHEIIHEMRVRGNIDPRKDKLYSYRFNPTHSKKKKSEIEISKLRQEVALLRQGMIHKHIPLHDSARNQMIMTTHTHVALTLIIF